MSTSRRMLSLLSMLQTHRHWPGQELAARLEVSPRTLRRDVERLRDLGYAVDATRGVAGGYQLRPGGQLPPLLLEDEEAVAIAVGLRAAASGAVGASVGGIAETSLQALTKLIGLMPPSLRGRMDALATQTESPGPWGAPAWDPDGSSVDAGLLSLLAQACSDHEPLRLAYTARGAGTTPRRVEPHRLVNLGRWWYLVAFDRDRDGWRSFRVDRIDDPRPSGHRFTPRELPAPDALTFVSDSMRSIPQRYVVRVRFAAPPEVVAARVGRWGEVVPTAGGCRLTLHVDTLRYPLVLLTEVAADFVIESPPELREEVARLAGRLARSAGAPHDGGASDGVGDVRPGPS